MQLLTASPREGLPEVTVRALLNADDLTVDFGADLLDDQDRFVESLAADLVGGRVARSNYADVHGTCELSLDRALAWGRDRVRPWQVLSSAMVGASARFHLGVFVLTTPQKGFAGDALYEVQGFDKLNLLQGPVGDTRTVAQGAGYLDAVRAAISAAGAGTRVLLDDSAAGKTLPSAMVWPLTETDSASWVNVVNDLLAAVGYRGLWVDQEGYFRSEPYRAPAERPVEWRFDVDDKRTNLVAEDRTLTEDVWGVFNWWRFLRRGLETPPTEGAGQYTTSNPDQGIASIASLDRVVRKVVWLDAADQASLVTQGDAIVATDRRVQGVLEVNTAPLPVAGHFDVATYSDAALSGEPAKVQARSWSLPLDGGDQQWVWEVL